MLTRYLHCIDNSGLASYISAGGQIQPLARYADGNDGSSQFAAWLSTARAGTHTILVDLPDEGFHSESIPYVAGTDRKTLIARKQAQLFFGSPFSTAISLGREKEGRRDERVLFTAITRPAALEPWLAVLRQQEAPLAALYSVPLLTRQLLGGLQVDAPRGLIVSFSSAGIRQTYFENGELRFSRLSPAPEGDYATWGEACLRESQKTLQYLSTQRWITRSTRLPVWLLLARHDFAPVLANLERAEQLDFRLVNLETLSHHFGERSRTTASDSLPLTMRLALRAGHAPQLAPDSERRSYRLQLLRRAILWGGSLAAMVLASLALHNHLSSRNLWQQRTTLQAESRQEELRYQQLLATLPQLPTSLESLHSVVNGIDQLAGRRADPAEALRRLSLALNAYADIDVQRIDWQLADEARSSASVTLEAALPLTAAADPRAAITRIRAFTAELRKPDSEVSLLALPFDVESDKTLRSSAETLNKRPEFKLRLLISQGVTP
ncbi:hypothetical protein Q9Q94_16910 [Uliginosibacterium sp. 31-16]|uniref:hypothetical protein n=1 Tax=Uliginosibacterium sp. 31-16 TaxID=3068315 RepID=UPI00273DDE35|nr:hypothetical protein [Uliginosibacterium sp. 31-16]MDP5241223.1 hypothetical protein [Uliginosibacterium sp. 31-16]